MVMEVTRVVNDGDNCLLSDLLANMEDSAAILMKQQGVFSISRQSCFMGSALNRTAPFMILKSNKVFFVSHYCCCIKDDINVVALKSNISIV